MKPLLFTSITSLSILLSACNSTQVDNQSTDSMTTSSTVTPVQVSQHFADLAYAMFSDSLSTAQTLQSRIDAFVETPNQANLDKAKQAYVAARIPYQQSEVLRFDIENGHVTPGLDKDGGPASIDDWEGQLNAWPLDEALIDYVDTSNYEGEYSSVKNIINTQGSFTVGGQTINVSSLSPEILASLNEIGGAEANVATGYHAIEFMLWGQDKNGTGPGAGDRPVSDYFTKSSQGNCTSGNKQSPAKICQRRAEYLQAAATLLIQDLEEMVAEWTPEAGTQKGSLRHDFLTRKDGLQRILDSMGDMAVGELASERMKVAILFGSTEDEHDCFSDATHVAIFNNAQGVFNAYTGSYTRSNGKKLNGPSLSSLVAQQNKNLDNELQKQLGDIMQKMQRIVDSAENGKKFDQLVGGTQADKQMVLDAAQALTDLDEPLSDGVGKVLAVKLAEFDPGTCPTLDAKDCES